jgi:hypothetical protein
MEINMDMPQLTGPEVQGAHGDCGTTQAGSPSEPWPAKTRRRGFSSFASGGFQASLSVLRTAHPLAGKVRAFVNGTARSPLVRHDVDVCAQDGAEGTRERPTGATRWAKGLNTYVHPELDPLPWGDRVRRSTFADGHSP